MQQQPADRRRQRRGFKFSPGNWRAVTQPATPCRTDHPRDTRTHHVGVVGELVAHFAQRLLQDDAASRNGRPSAATTASSVASASNSGRAQEPTPDARRRAQLQQHRTVRPSIASTVADRVGRCFHRPRSRQPVDRLLTSRNTAGIAPGMPGISDGCACTSSRPDPSVPVCTHQSAVRQQALPRAATIALDLRAAGIAVDREVPRQHALDVAVENRGALVKGKRGNRSCGRAADARQPRQCSARRETRRHGHRRSAARSAADCARASSNPARPSCAITASTRRRRPAHAHQQIARMKRW